EMSPEWSAAATRLYLEECVPITAAQRALKTGDIFALENIRSVVRSSILAASAQQDERRRCQSSLDTYAVPKRRSAVAASARPLTRFPSSSPISAVGCGISKKSSGSRYSSGLMAASGPHGRDAISSEGFDVYLMSCSSSLNARRPWAAVRLDA